MCAEDAAVYEIRVGGILDDRWSECFDGMTLSSDDASGETTLSGSVPDQAALHGLIARVRDLGMPLLSVRQRDTDRPVHQPAPDRRDTDTKERNQ